MCDVNRAEECTISEEKMVANDENVENKEELLKSKYFENPLDEKNAGTMISVENEIHKSAIIFTEDKSENDTEMQTDEQISKEVVSKLCDDVNKKIIENESQTTVDKEVQSNDTNDNLSNLRYDWNVSPRLLCSATEEYTPSNLYENFTKGCSWSPDGTCLLVPSEDYRIRIYELPRELYSGQIPKDLKLPALKPALTIKDGGIIYDSCWYPFMNSWEPATCCFLSTSRESPVHLWDAFNGELRATYRAYNQVDEVEAAISTQFVDSGKEIWCGFKGSLRIFYTDRPGRQIDTISFKTSFPNVTGLVSCIRENPVMPGLIAFGTYSKCIGLYKDGPLCTFKTGNGVTQIEFSSCGTKLYSAVRRSHEFLCWDLRNPGTVLWSSENRQANTNQRIQFSISVDGSNIVSGGTDGFISIWQVGESSSCEYDVKPTYKKSISKDCINGVSLHKSLPILATSSGQRLCEDECIQRDNSVRLWYCSN